MAFFTSATDSSHGPASGSVLKSGRTTLVSTQRSSSCIKLIFSSDIYLSLSASLWFYGGQAGVAHRNQSQAVRVPDAVIGCRSRLTVRRSTCGSLDNSGWPLQWEKVSNKCSLVGFCVPCSLVPCSLGRRGADGQEVFLGFAAPAVERGGSRARTQKINFSWPTTFATCGANSQAQLQLDR